MPVFYSAALKTARMQQVADALDAAGPGASLVIGTAALAGGGVGVLASILLEIPSAAVLEDELTIAGMPLTSLVTANGTAAKAELRDAAGGVVVGGLTIGTVDADIIVTNVLCFEGETIQLTMGSLKHG